MTFRPLTLALAAAAAGVTGLSAVAAELSGPIVIDGSSTVYPITEAAGKAFQEENPAVRVTVGVSGTGGGFKRFTKGETDISDASRPIKAQELKVAMDNDIEFIEIPVAYDGLTIAVNPSNSWANELTVDHLKKIFLADSPAETWKDVNPSFPDTPITIYAPGTDSGTFDYFKEVVAGKEGEMRSDMNVSEDDNVLVTGVAGDKGAIGFFGASYYFENEDKLKAVGIINEDGDAVLPSPSTIEDGSYNPFSRPLFIYVNKDSLNKPQVREFVEFYLDEGPDLAEEVGYVRLPSSVYDAARENVDTMETGTDYLDDNMEKVEGPVTQVYN